MTARLKTGIRTRILLATGGVVTVMMMAISLAILTTWRSVIIDKQISNCESLARAFSIPVLDALIYAEHQGIQREDVLESYVDNFSSSSVGATYIMISDAQNRIIAHTDKNQFNRIVSDSISSGLLASAAIVSSIHNHPAHGWIIETAVPLFVGERRLGVMRIGFNAAPIRDEIRSIFILLFGLTLIVTAGTLSVLYLLINRFTLSLKDLVKEIDNIESDNTISAVIPAGSDEIALLLQHVNDLKNRLSQSRLQLEKAQKQIIQSEKLASIGRLASGVAHEINNPINGIKNCLLLIRREPENAAAAAQYLALVEEGVSYIENIVQKLLGFARRQSKVVSSVDVNELIRKVIELTAFRLRQKQVQLEFQSAKNLPVIKADPLLIQEVVMNLLINSLDAVDTGGWIQIVTDCADGTHVLISISDNGGGIAPAEMDVIFDPFFTTKEPGVGTGLGLSVCMGIVEQHGGSIRAESTPHESTTFTVFLPLDYPNENSPR